MASNQPGGVWWANMPLPPGWQAKYDQNTKKYFFMHHSTRSTQWVDPRKAYYEQQRMQQAPQRMPQHSPRMPQHSPRMPQHSPWTPQGPQHPTAVRQPGPSIPMQPIVKPKCRTCKTNEVPSNGQECQSCQVKARQREVELVRAREAEEAERKRQETQQRIQKEQERRRVQSAARNRTPMTVSTNYQETTFNDDETPAALTDGQKRTITKNLGEAFPDVGKTVVEMVLESSSWDTDKATSVLRSMAKEKPAKPEPKPVSFAKVKMPAKPAATAAPSETKKREMREYLKKTFPSASETLIELALETTLYNQSKACSVLRMTLQDDTPTRSAAKSGPSTSTPATQQPSSSQPKPSISPAPTAAVTPSTVPKTSPSTATSSLPSSSPKRTSVTITAPPASTVTTRVVTPKPVVPQPVAQQARVRAAVKAKDKTRRTKSAERAPKEAIVSSYTRRPSGPDKSLVTGPNSENLLTTYTVVQGSDRAAVKGPMKENASGSSHNFGHDASLAAGPQEGYCIGAQANLAKGSMYNAGRQM